MTTTPKKPAAKSTRATKATKAATGSTSATEKSKGGRPSKYRDEFAKQALKLCRLGATDKELADFFGVNEDTVNEWKKVHPAFSESLKEGKGLADAEVADKLFKRATGYEHEAVKISADPAGREHVTHYTERYPPDTTAAIFWLKNRRPDLWRDKTDINHGGQADNPMRMLMDQVAGKFQVKE